MTAKHNAEVRVGVKDATKAGFGNISRRLNSLDRMSRKFKIGTAGLAAVVGGSVVKFSKYEKSLAEVDTLLSKTDNLIGYRKGIEDLSRTFGTDQTATAQAMYQVISAGAADATEATEILTAANKLALGGVTDIETAADGLTSVLNAYGIEAAQAGSVSDSFFVAMKAGKTTIGELAENIGTVAPLAKTMGLSLDETLASVSALTKGGVSTSEAITQVRGALTAIVKPSKQAMDIAAELGLEFDSQALRTKGLSGFMADLAEKTGGNQETMAKLFGRVEALNGVLALTGEQADSFNSILEDMSGKAGASDEAVAKMTNTLDFKWNAVITDIKELAISFGQVLAPAAKLFLDVARPIIQTLTYITQGLGLFLSAAVDLGEWVGGKLVDSFKSWDNLLTGGYITQYTSNLLTLTKVIYGNVIKAFQNAKLVGIAMVNGVMVGVENLKYGFGVMAVSIKYAWNKSIDAIRKKFSEMFTAISKGLSAAGFDDWADEIDGVAKSISGAQSSTEDYNRSIEELRRQKDEAITSINVITDSMVDYEIATREADAANELLMNSSNDLSNNGLPDVVDALEDNITTLEEVTVTAEKLAIASNDSAEDVTSGWQDAASSLDGILDPFFESSTSDWNSYTGNILDSWVDMLADMAEAWLKSGVTQWLSSGLSGNGWTDTSGFNSDAFFGGGGGGGYGGSGGGDLTSAVIGEQNAGYLNLAGSGYSTVQAASDGDWVEALASGYGTYQQGVSLGLWGGGTTASGAGGGYIATTSSSTAAASTSTALSEVTVTGEYLSTGATGSSSATAALGATAAWIAAGLLVDEYFNDGRVANAFMVEQRGRKAGWDDLWDGNFASFRDAQFQAPYDALKATFAARSSEQILYEDYLPALLDGWDGQNEAMLGHDFGIKGSGLTAQHLADGGANGNGGFLTGAQSSLDALEAIFKEQGYDMVKNEGGVLKVIDKEKTTEDILEVWRTYSEGLDEAIAHSEVFTTAMETGLLGVESESRDFFESFAIGFGQIPADAKASIAAIDTEFDRMVENGMNDYDALATAISEHYGIAVEEAALFVDYSGVAAEQWIENFKNASGEGINSMLEFNEAGMTAFEGISNAAYTSANEVSSFYRDKFTGMLDNIDVGSLNIPKTQVEVETVYTSVGNEKESGTESYGLDLSNSVSSVSFAKEGIDQNSTSGYNSERELVASVQELVDEMKSATVDNKLDRAALNN